jgi:hypothetical protein
MRRNVYAGQQGKLRLEQKVSWVQGMLTRAPLLYHGGPMLPVDVRRDGLDAVRFGAEYVVDDGTKAPFAGGKLIFAFLVGTADADADLATWDKPAAARRLWGEAGHGYMFRAPIGTEYYSTSGTIGANKEIAFAYLIEAADIAYYCSPDTRGMRGGALRSFQRVPWHVVTTALIN